MRRRVVLAAVAATAVVGYVVPALPQTSGPVSVSPNGVGR